MTDDEVKYLAWRIRTALTAAQVNLMTDLKGKIEMTIVEAIRQGMTDYPALAAERNQPAKAALSELAEKILSAMRSLHKDYTQHNCGGFNIDDMRWRMGKIFESDETMHEAIDELLNAKLIKSAGEDDTAAYACCYLLTPWP